MKHTIIKAMARLGICLGLVASPAILADTVFKCVVNGKANFTSTPKGGQNCQSLDLKVVQPSPAEVERELEKKRIRDEEYQKKEDKRALEKQERQTDAALKRAKTAEEAMRLLKDAPPWGNGRSRTWTGYFPQQGPTARH